jgi:glutaminase
VDLKRVVAADRSSILVLSELCARTVGEGKWLFFTTCQHLYQFRRQLQKLADENKAQVPGWLEFDDTDYAVEWCENDLIAAGIDLASAPKSSRMDLGQQYLCSGMTKIELAHLNETGVEKQFAAGTPIVRAGDPADCLYFILSGEVDVLVDTDAGGQLRLTTLGAGTVFGEVALVNRQRRTANVTATMDSVCLQVCFDALEDGVKTKMLVNMASYFASKIQQDTELMKYLG